MTIRLRIISTDDCLPYRKECKAKHLRGKMPHQSGQMLKLRGEALEVMCVKGSRFCFENSKPEIGMPKEAQNAKFKLRIGPHYLRFGFRISGFGFDPTGLKPLCPKVSAPCRGGCGSRSGGCRYAGS